MWYFLLFKYGITIYSSKGDASRTKRCWKKLPVWVLSGIGPKPNSNDKITLTTNYLPNPNVTTIFYFAGKTWKAWYMWFTKIKSVKIFKLLTLLFNENPEKGGIFISLWKILMRLFWNSYKKKKKTMNIGLILICCMDLNYSVVRFGSCITTSMNFLEF